jgi:hypothetical protein
MDIKITFNKISVSASLNNKLNILTGNSGTGKTLFIYAFKAYCEKNNIRYAFFDYNYYDKSAEQIIDACKESDIILMDNADLYISKDIMKEIKDKSKLIILVLKNTAMIDNTEATEYIAHYANLKLTLEEI